MSDSWYRDPPDLPPFEDGLGRLWTLDGTCLNPPPEPDPTVHPDMLAAEFEADVVMTFFDMLREAS